ncbi:MAG: CoA transferase [Pseudomonadota bacterium]|nr:CoA transferase [Pseudomonadota bacterium]MEE3100220.1 CoA transferase [Pseudomonadota bacterium]
MTGPLAGIRVADFTELLPGPFLTQALAEMGAEVVKVERPPRGDLVRTVSPGLFAAVNRGKRSRVANLKDEGDRAAALDLAAAADVVVEGYRPGVMDRLGLGYAAVRARNPRVVYLSLTGYGQTGPLRDVPGHDLNYLATAGMTSLCGAPDGPPRHGIGAPVADLGGAVYGLSAILAALFQRERTGAGQYLDLSMTDCVAHMLNARKGVYAAGGVADLAGQRALALARPAYGVFDVTDGAVTVAALELHFWKALVALLDLADWAGPEFHPTPARAARCAEINAAVAAKLAPLTREAAVAMLLGADIPAAPVLTVAEADASPHFAARGLAVPTASGRLTPFPVRLAGMAPMAVVPSPLGDQEEGRGEGRG